MPKPEKTQKNATDLPTRRNLMSRWQDELVQMERMFDELWPLPVPQMFDRLRSLPRAVMPPGPSIDVYDEGNEIIVKAEIPGSKKEEITVDLADSGLTISGAKERKEEVKDDQYYLCERSYGSFSRSVELPSEIQSDKAGASFTDGVLEIRLPKTEEAKRKAVKVKIS